MLQRGFKTWSENTAAQIRRALGLAPYAPIDPLQLAAHLGVEVRQVSEVPGLDHKTLAVLTVQDRDSWSAVTLSSNGKAVIILNSSHRGARPASSLMHELAHIVIGHSPARVDVTEDGALLLDSYDKTQEEEATWLAGCILLPREALVRIIRARTDLSEAASSYGVSYDMLRFRLNVTGVKHQFGRLRQAVRK